MRQKDELIDETKKKNGVMKLLRFIGIAAMILGIGLKLYDFYANREMRHFFEDRYCITELTKEEQSMVLSVFDVVIPENETTACISAFGKREEIYFIEFDSVKNNQNFYNANKHRIGENGISGLSVNETTNDNGDHYLTYAEYVFPHSEVEKQRIADLYSELSESRK